MIKFENTSVMNFENAVRGARNPLSSHAKSDSYYENRGGTLNYDRYILGENDLGLLKRLCKAGSDHRKFMRQIFVSVDITAPMTWWWDVDTYKVATVRNSSSRMHKMTSRLLTFDDFSYDNNEYEVEITSLRKYTLEDINRRIEEYNNLSNKTTSYAKNLWRSIIFDLPDSYNFLSTWTGNYEVLRNIYNARHNHKQREFRDFCVWISMLPYAEELIIGE